MRNSVITLPGTEEQVTRRQFLGTAIGACLLPMIVPASALGRDGTVSPANRVTVGFIGLGRKGTDNLRMLLARSEVQVVALCDVDKEHLDAARRLVTTEYESDDCFTTGDFREVTRRTDVDAVVISTPDHWHVLPALDATRHGKDSYVEKPLTLTIEEGRLLADDVARYGRILQTGTQQRSSGLFRFACELVRNGKIGDLETIEIEIPINSAISPMRWEPEAPPDHFDYDMWLGPAAWKPYHPERCHYNFRFVRDYSGGQVTNWGTHYLDIAQWALDADDSGPVQVRGQGSFPREGLFDTAARVDFQCTYANGIRMSCRTRRDEIYDGIIRFSGSQGWIQATRATLETFPDSLLDERTRPSEINLVRSYDHIGNFLDSVRTRVAPIAPAEAGHRSATICHLANIAMLLERPLIWDPLTERFSGDDQADRLLGRVLRGPWQY